jgi:pilus assembly protein CpaE
VPQRAVERVLGPGIRRQRTQVITVWSSKGGDGKSSIAAELGYLLANVAGRTVLLVDADMNRGYLAPALGEAAMDHARVRNIAGLAAVFHGQGHLPRLAEYVYNYPPAFGRAEGSNLEILFGISGMDQAGLPAFTAEGGAAAEAFIAALIGAAENRYEFVIFDIGTLVPVHVHQAALKAASQLIVVSSPLIPAIQPTKAGIEQMKRYGILDERADKAVLVLNKFSEESGLARDEFPRFIQLPLMATIPLVPEGLLHAITNQGSFFMQHYLHSRSAEPLGVMAQQLLGLCEFFSPGALASAQQVPRLAELVSHGSRSLFRRKKARA